MSCNIKKFLCSFVFVSCLALAYDLYAPPYDPTGSGSWEEDPMSQQYLNQEKDTDADGILDSSDNCPSAPNPGQIDSDNDRQGNACDADDDNDGVLDANDNCRTVANPFQKDTDNDDQGNACDTDDDNDGVEDELDNCPLVINPKQNDRDNDGIGNACDVD
jgi:hypothetical protein